MKKLLCALATLSTILILPIASYAHAPASANNKSLTSLAPMLSKVTPAVVSISVEKSIPKATNPTQPEAAQAQAPTKILGVGSGVIVDAKKGYIVTNAHVVNDQKVMIVTLKDGSHYRAKLIGKDDGFDLAAIQIKAKHLTPISFGNSNQLKVGDFVVAVGSPFNLSQTVTSGVISALNRSQPQIEGFQSFIQTDAPINPGNSGGALISMNGQLMGINTAIVTPSSGNIGIGFAIPSDMVKSVADQLIKYGKVERGLLGVLAQNITPELADAMHLKHTQGAIVTQAVEGSPAAKAGLKAEDVIVSVNGEAVHDSVQLHNMLGIMRPGTHITLTVLRNHKKQQLPTVVGNPKTVTLQRELPFLAGMRLQKYSDLEPDGNVLNGILVISVSDTSDGALAGLTPGDVITGVNNTPISNVQQLVKIATSKPEQLLLNIARGNGKLFLVLQNQ
jgi:Do/DeqQ family serine protease